MVLEELGSKLRKALSSLTQCKILDEDAIQVVIKQLSMALLQADIHVQLVKQLQTQVLRVARDPSIPQGHNRRRLMHQVILQEIVRLVTPARASFVPAKRGTNRQCQVLMFVGLQGSGKTTNCCKLARHYKQQGWKTALVCADTFRAGAFDQLKQNATRIRVPFYGTYAERDPALVAAAGVAQFRADGMELILVDTSGRHKQESALLEEMQVVAKAISPDSVMYVMDALQGQAARDQVLAFHRVISIDSVILTKMDSHAKGGGAISAVVETGAAILCIGTGEHMEDLQMFNPQSFVSRLLGFGDLNGLLQLCEDHQLVTKDKEADYQQMMNRWMSKEHAITYRDIREQLETVRRLGPLDKIIDMIPGMSTLLKRGGEEERRACIQRMQRWFIVMDSMTQKELDGNHTLFVREPSRYQRLARGSGVARDSIIEMIEHFRKMAVQMKNALKRMEEDGMLSSAGASGSAANLNGLTDILSGKPRVGGKAQRRARATAARLRHQLMGSDTSGVAKLQSTMSEVSNLSGSVDEDQQEAFIQQFLQKHPQQRSMMAKLLANDPSAGGQFGDETQAAQLLSELQRGKKLRDITNS